MSEAQVVAILIGAPAWAPDAARLLRAAGLRTIALEDPTRYLDRLIDAHPALIMVDGDMPGWPWWVTTPKVRQETRRIPLLVIASDPHIKIDAREAGADHFLDVATLGDTLPAAIDALARVPDTSWLDELACQCAEPMPLPGQEGIARFNAGDYYGQHDFFEALWMAEPGPVRDLYRAILQVGVAYHHITQGNPRGALKMLRRSAQWFASLPDVCQGVNVRQLREDAAAVEAALRAADGADFDAAEWLPLPPLRTISDTES